MSLVKEKLFEQEEEKRAAEWMQYFLTSEKLINPVEIGIAKQIIETGLSSLTSKQKKVYQQYIYPKTQIKCDCGCDLDVADVIEDDGLCSYCRRLFSKND